MDSKIDTSAIMTRKMKTADLNAAFVSATEERGKCENALDRAITAQTAATKDLDLYIQETRRLADELPA